jgi:FMN phosphatase YigB (HAD superfamily)
VGDGSYRELSGATAVGMRAVMIRDPDEDAEVLRFDADDWDGPAIADLREVPGLVRV